MKQEDVIALCHYYKGEQDCPYTDSINAQLWMAEMMACTDLIEMIGDNSPKDDFDSVVFAYVSKWNPYTFRDTLDEYIKVTHPKQAIIDTYYN